MSKKKGKVHYWTSRGSTLFHEDSECNVLLRGDKPEVIGSMEIGMRRLQPCECAGGNLTHHKGNATIAQEQTQQKGEGEEDGG